MYSNERDVFDHWEDNEQIYIHEQALEGGNQNTVNLNYTHNTSVNIYNTSTEEGKYNAINVAGESETVYINVSGGHTKIKFNPLTFINAILDLFRHKTL